MVLPIAVISSIHASYHSRKESDGVMALVRTTVRWFKARLCTGFLVIVLCAVAWFAMSASYHSLHKDPASNVDYEAGELQAADERRHLLGGTDNDGNPSQNDDDDDDVQICKYPLVAAAETIDAWDEEPDTCAAHPQNLFYFEDGLLRTYARVLDDKRLDRCEFRGIVWNRDSNFEYTEPLVRRPPDSFDVEIDHDFVHVQCYLEHRRGGQSAYGVRRREKERIEEALKEVQQESQGRSRRDEQRTNRGKEKKSEVEGSKGSDAKPRFQFQDVKDFHRSVVHQNSPRLVGSLGLPDFRDNFVGQKTKTDSMKPKKKDSRHLLAVPDSQGQVANEVDHDQPTTYFPEPERGVKSRVAIEQDEGNEDEDLSKGNEDENLSKGNEDENLSKGNEDEDLSTKPSFDQFLVQVSEKPLVVDRVTKKASTSPSASSIDQMNVLLLAIDSVSRTSFKRNFQRTSQFLAEELKSVVMNGYNSVGDAATAAVIPLITGLKEQEVRRIGKGGDGRQYVDELSFVWYKFEQNGYVTLYAEDQPELGTFQTHYYGFEDIPVNHYMRPFWLAASASQLDATSQPNCLGSIPKHKYTLDYLADFFTKYKSTPKFAFGFLSEFNRSQVVDDDLVNFLERLKEGGHLENTLLVVLGDHGSSYGPMRSTIAGKLEESLPYLSLAFPSGFWKKYGRLMTNLRTNRFRLTTAFDVHKTLMTLLDINSTQLPVNVTSRAISLLQEIPLQRTCKSAEVDVHWCTCVKFEQMRDVETLMSKVEQMMASIAVQDINRLLEKEDKDNQCATLKLNNLQDVRVVFTNEAILTLENKLEGGKSEVFNISRSNPLFVRYHQVTFTTTPGDALFEATVLSTSDSTSGYVIDGQISRINAYGRESECIVKTHPNLRKYCHCTRPEV